DAAADPAAFWAQQARARLDWIQDFAQASDCSFVDGRLAWFVGGKLNAAWNCVDRHLPAKADQPAIIWEGDEPGQVRRISYRQLQELVCRIANVLRSHGVGKGDRVAIYMPMVPEAAAAMLACARIGAIHSVVFA